MWCASRPPAVTDIFGKGWFKAFAILNLFAIATGISLFELFFLNSIKRPIVSSSALGKPA